MLWRAKDDTHPAGELLVFDRVETREAVIKGLITQGEVQSKPDCK